MTSKIDITDLSLYRAMAEELNAHPETFTVLGEFSQNSDTTRPIGSSNRTIS